MGLVQELINVNSPLDVNAEMGGENLADKTHHEPSELVFWVWQLTAWPKTTAGETTTIDAFHKWLPIHYSFVLVQISLPSLIVMC